MTLTNLPPTISVAASLAAVTEAAALAASRWVGRADKNAADQAAVDAMRTAMAGLPISGTIVIGEGEKDAAPMLYRGERLGAPTGPAYDLAVDPVDGTTQTAKGMPGAIAVIAASPAGTMFDASTVHYMRKLVAAPGIAIDIQAPIAHNISIAAKARGVPVEQVIVCVLDRPRHDNLIREVCASGARVRMIPDGDVVGALMAAMSVGVDLLAGVGGAPEGIVSACAIHCLGGALQAQLHPSNEKEHAALAAAGWDPEQVLTAKDLVTSDNTAFALTGITDGMLVAGVRHSSATDPTGATTESLILDGSERATRRVVHRQLLAS